MAPLLSRQSRGAGWAGSLTVALTSKVDHGAWQPVMRAVLVCFAAGLGRSLDQLIDTSVEGPYCRHGAPIVQVARIPSQTLITLKLACAPSAICQSTWKVTSVIGG